MDAVRPSRDLDIGGDVTIRLDEDGGGLIWRHPDCRKLVDGVWHARALSAWMTLRFRPDSRSTGHVLVAPWPDLTIEGSLLCPAGCGKHGWIRDGRWVP